MTQLFLLCHEGDLPYVARELREILFDDSTMQIVDQGSTEKMYMGYMLLEGEGEIPLALLAELRNNPDVYLYAVHDPDAPGEESGDGNGGESERPIRGCEPFPLQL